MKKKEKQAKYLLKYSQRCVMKWRTPQAYKELCNEIVIGN